MPRGYVLLAIFKRNFLSYFSGMLGYLFIVVFVVLGAFLAFRPEFFTNNLANLDQLNQYFPMLLLFIIPAITMSVWAEEKKQGTDELLFTLPVSDLEVLLAKYFAVLAVYTVTLLFSTTHLIVLELIGDPDWGLMATTYFGYWVSGAALLTAGMVASYLTPSPTIAFVLGALICAVPVFIGEIWPSSDLLRGLSLREQFRDFGMGMVPLGGLLYFISLAVFMLYVNYVLIRRRHWASGRQSAKMGLQFFARAISLAVVLVSVNVLAANATTRVDATSEGLYSVSPTTKTLLRELDKDRTVTIQAFVSPDVPREYVPVRTTLIGLLRQYDQIGGDRVNIRILEVERFSEEAEQARQYGIEPREVQSNRGGRVLMEGIFLGAVVNSGANEVVIPFFDVGIPIEYELTRSVRTVAQEKRLTVGVLTTDAKVMGGFDMSSFRSTPEWQIVTELRKQYKVEEVSADAEIDAGKYDVLMAVLPSSLTQPQMQNFVAYVNKGKPVLIFDDPLPVYNGGMGLQNAPRLPKPRQGGMFGGGPPPEQKADQGKLTSLLNTLEIAWPYDEVVWDLSFATLHPEFSDVVRPELFSISPKSGTRSAFSEESEITKGLQEILVFFSGTVRPRANSKHNFIPLLRTGPDSGLIGWDDLTEPSMFGGVSIREEPYRGTPDPYAHVVAAQVKGEKRNAIFIADIDLISDWVFSVRERELYGLKLDNVTFVLNSVDALAGDDAYLALRKRRPKHRTLVSVEQRTQKFLDERSRQQEKANEEAKQKLEEARERFRKRVEEINEDKSLDADARAQLLRIAQENERRRIEVAEANIEREKQQVIDRIKAQTERQIQSAENNVRVWAIVIPPIPAILLGLMMFGIRLKNERRDISPSRRLDSK